MIVLQAMQPVHAPAVLEIYRQGIETGHATFETKTPSWEVFDKKFLPHSRIVALHENEVVGWAVLAASSVRECYKGVADISIYIHEKARGQGVGKAIMPKLIESSEQNGVWTLQSLIHPENQVSIHLHELFGFRMVGYREKIGMLHGTWKDIVLMERRSPVVGL